LGLGAADVARLRPHVTALRGACRASELRARGDCRTGTWRARHDILHRWHRGAVRHDGPARGAEGGALPRC
ncbi:MAG: hypothetical protein ABWY63_14010, partial [Hyphomicrobiaceae bacterium]